MLDMALITVMTLSFRTTKFGQTVQTQSDQGLHCLLFYLHLLEAFLCCKANLFGRVVRPSCRVIIAIFWVSENLGLLRY